MLNGSLLRFAGRTAATLFGLVLVLVIVVYGGSETMLRHQYELPSHAPFAAPTSADSTLVVRGQHVADPIAKCAECHGPGLAGRVFIDDPAFGRFIAPNLTRGAGGLGARLTDEDY
jgi:mono/diheme cytochrome c family protein